MQYENVSSQMFLIDGGMVILVFLFIIIKISIEKFIIIIFDGQLIIYQLIVSMKLFLILLAMTL